MHTITVKQFVDAPLEDVWNSWKDFDNVERFSSVVRESRLLGDIRGAIGVGTKRECELSDGRNWLREEIVEFVPLKTISVDVYESSLPIRSMRATLRLRKLADSRTETVMTVEFVPRRGLLGKMMGPLFKRRFRPIVATSLSDNASWVERHTCNKKAA